MYWSNALCTCRTDSCLTLGCRERLPLRRQTQPPPEAAAGRRCRGGCGGTARNQAGAGGRDSGRASLRGCTPHQGAADERPPAAGCNAGHRCCSGIALATKIIQLLGVPSNRSFHRMCRLAACSRDAVQCRCWRRDCTAWAAAPPAQRCTARSWLPLPALRGPQRACRPCPLRPRQRPQPLHQTGPRAQIRPQLQAPRHQLRPLGRLRRIPQRWHSQHA